MSDLYCSDCKRKTEVVFDHTTGGTICSVCGLVLESRSIDETFADHFGDHDPNRAGGPVNPLPGDAVPSNVISRGANGSTVSRLRNRRRNRETLASKTITSMADRFNLVPTIKDRVREMYKRLEDQKCTRGRPVKPLVLGCIYFACRQEDKPRTLKEICSTVAGVTKTELGQATAFIMKQLKFEMGESMEMGTIQAGDNLFMRWCSHLGMDNEEVKAVQETIQKAGDCDIRRSPLSIAAAIIFMITRLSDSKKPLRDIASATSVAEATIKHACRDIYPHAAKIIPDWYAKEKDLKNLRGFKA